MAAMGEEALIHLLNGNALKIPLADKSVHMCVTSPPYWGLRDYGLATWEGGDPGCDHSKDRSAGIASSTLEGGKSTTNHQQEASYRDTCARCGAIRHDAGLGLEATIDEYVANMVAAFREVWRVLRDDGTVWLNLGDSYSSQGGPEPAQTKWRVDGASNTQNGGRSRNTPASLKPKDLCGIPWRVAFALQADGWYLRSDIIWSKLNPMPESCTDRPTKAHEYLFLLSKRAKYAYDADAVMEEHQNGPEWIGRPPTVKLKSNGDRNDAGSRAVTGNPAGRNRRTVWSIATQPYSGAHFATFPEALVEPCIKAGASEAGCCPECGAQFERVTEQGGKVSTDGRKTWNINKNTDSTLVKSAEVWRRKNTQLRSMAYKYETTGFSPTCAHTNDAQPCLVLDPFCGSGTVGLVARRLGRHFVGIDLSAEYLQLARQRLELDRLEAWSNGRKVEDEDYSKLPLFVEVST